MALPDRPVTSPAQPACAPPDKPARREAAYAWVRLLARIYEVLPLVCPRCGTDMHLIAFITESSAVHAILVHPGEPTMPPALDSAGSDLVTLDQSLRWDLSAAPAGLWAATHSWLHPSRCPALHRWRRRIRGQSASQTPEQT
jgi:hypothetical protein